MRRLSVAATFLILSFASALPQSAAETGVIIITPESIVYQPAPGLPGVSSALLLGSRTGPYTIRARITAGSKIAAHTHPDTRVVTVISGIYFFAVGESFDDSVLTAYEPGTVIVVPGGTPHFSAARDNDVYVQESGPGPTANTPTGR